MRRIALSPDNLPPWILAAALVSAAFVCARTPPPAVVRPVRVEPAESAWYIWAALDGAGARTGRRIATAQAEFGPFTSWPDLLEVPSVGARTLERWFDTPNAFSPPPLDSPK